jgi:hypothetical protein
MSFSPQPFPVCEPAHTGSRPRRHVDKAWIAEVEASYTLQDWLQLNEVPRAFVLREGPIGITDLRVYGAHDHALTDHRTGDEWGT